MFSLIFHLTMIALFIFLIMIYLGMVLLESVNICTSFFLLDSQIKGLLGALARCVSSFPVFRKHEHTLKSKETNPKKPRACLKNEYMAPNDLTKTAVYAFLFHLEQLMFHFWQRGKWTENKPLHKLWDLFLTASQ